MTRFGALMLVAVLCLWAGGQRTLAALIAQDRFEAYTAGSNLAGGNAGTGWTAAWEADATNPAPSGTVTVQSGVIPDFGQSVQIAGGGLPDVQVRNLVRRNFPAQSGTVYIGFLLKASSWESDDFFTMYTNNLAGSTSDNGAEAGITTGPSNYFTRKGGSGTARATGFTFVNDATVQLVLKLSKSPQAPPGDYDHLDLFLNQATEGTPDVSRTSAQTPLAGNANLEEMLSFVHFRLNSPEVGDLIYFDELRIATTFSEALAVPEPSTAIMIFVLAALVSVAGLRQRNAH